MNEKELLWLWLYHVVGPCSDRYKVLLEQYGYLEEIYRDRKGSRLMNLLPPAAYKRACTAEKGEFEQTAERLARIGARMIPYNDTLYPTRLRATRVPPMLLFVTGNVKALSAPQMIAGVGTRHITQYGRDTAEHICRPIAEAGVTLVSGLAHGTDTEVHRAALRYGAPTVAVLGTAIDRTCPAANAALRAEIEAAGGAVVSEYPPGAYESRWNFPQRNRIISGLSRAVIIFEGSQKSGTMITANWALDDGRDVFAVPGSILSEQSSGTNRLIELGASPALSGESILQQLAIPYTPKAAAEQAKPVQQKFSADEKKIIACLQTGEKHTEQLMHETGLAPHLLFSALTELEINGAVKALPGSRYQISYQ